MKKINKILHSKTSIAVIAVMFLAVAGYFAMTDFVRPAKADTGIAVTGWAWGGFEIGGTPGAASGIGWIHFNGTAVDGSKYGVEEDPDTGVLSGFAWSSNYGWVSFNTADLKGCASGTCEAQVSTTTGKVTGWARICSALLDTDNPDNITNDKRGNESNCKTQAGTGGSNGKLDPGTSGWDGFVHLSGTTTGGSSYGVTVDTNNQWSGYAWGANDVGWISFSGKTKDGTTYKVCTNDCKSYNEPITLTCTATPSNGSPVRAGDSVIWSVNNVKGGDGGPYTYSWSDPNNASDPINSSADKNKASDKVTYNTAGDKYEGQVTVSDSSGLVSYCNAKLSVQSPSNTVCTDPGGCTGTGPGNKTPPKPPVCTATPLPAECVSVKNKAATATLTVDGGSTATVSLGDSVNLTWNSTNAKSCTGPDASLNTTGKTSGSGKVTPNPTFPDGTSEETVTYAVTCSNYDSPAQQTTKTVTVKVYKPVITVSTTPTRVGKNGGEVTVTWSATGVKDNSCTVTGPGVNESGENSGTASTTVTVQSKYVVTCQTVSGGSVSNYAIVNISPTFTNF